MSTTSIDPRLRKLTFAKRRKDLRIDHIDVRGCEQRLDRDLICFLDRKPSWMAVHLIDMCAKRARFISGKGSVDASDAILPKGRCEEFRDRGFANTVQSFEDNEPSLLPICHKPAPFTSLQQ